MKKVIIGLLIVSAMAVIGIGGYFTYQNLHENKNDKTEKNNSSASEKSTEKNKIPNNATEIEAVKKENFSDGVAWVKDKNQNYYLIDETGKALFGLDSQKEDGVVKVDSYSNGYGMVYYYNEETSTNYKKIFDKKGNMVYAEWDGTGARHDVIAGPDDKGFIVVNNLGKVESVNLNTGKVITNSANWSSDTRELESIGGGIFFNKYIGFFNASSGSSMPLEALDIYDYYAPANFTSVKMGKYDWTNFIDGKAIFCSASTNYLVTNEGEVTEIDKLKGYKLTIDNSKAQGVENTFNGKTVYGENPNTKDKGYFDLEGNKVVDLSKYDNIFKKFAMYNGKFVITFSTDNLNEDLFTVIDEDGKELFEPKEYTSYCYLGDEIICADGYIYNYKGEIIKDLSDYDWAMKFDYGDNDTITVCPESHDLEENRLYLNSELQEIKPYYENNLELK